MMYLKMSDNQFYTNERAQQILIAVLKANNIKKVVASPGTASMSLIVSMEHDGAFEMYSSIDERSAAYIACGLSAESGEPVVLVCTEATASRNYGPGLTEAFYRKLPILAVTGSHGEHLIGQLQPQVIDRRTIANDVANLDVRVHMIKDNDDDRPDIVLFFSGDPTKEGNMVDVVVIELKRLGISAEQNSIVEFQLDTRTQRLTEYYGNRIQRMWFYGIVDFDDKYRLHLVNNGFKPLFSNGSSYFRSKEVFTDLHQTNSVIQNAYIMDFKALVEDANSRNETFLKILKNNFNNV